VGAVVLWQNIGLVIDRAWVPLSHGPLQATSSKLRPTQPPTLSEMGNEL